MGVLYIRQGGVFVPVIPGATGPAGATGATGPAGVAGTAGSAGAVGATGPAGPVGATGVTGATGPAGATGASGVAAGGGLPAFYAYRKATSTSRSDNTFAADPDLVTGTLTAGNYWFEGFITVYGSPGTAQPIFYLNYTGTVTSSWKSIDSYQIGSNGTSTMSNTADAALTTQYQATGGGSYGYYRFRGRLVTGTSGVLSVTWKSSGGGYLDTGSYLSVMPTA